MVGDCVGTAVLLEVPFVAGDGVGTVVVVVTVLFVSTGDCVGILVVVVAADGVTVGLLVVVVGTTTWVGVSVGFAVTGVAMGEMVGKCSASFV